MFLCVPFGDKMHCLEAHLGGTNGIVEYALAKKPVIPRVCIALTMVDVTDYESNQCKYPT